MTVTKQKPDFSGEWTLNRHASVLSPAVAPSVQSGALRIEHDEPAFAGHMTIVMDGKPFESRFELRSDGGDVAASDEAEQIVSSLRWDGDALVATWQIRRPDGEMTISFRYELEEGGRRLRAAEQLRSAARDQDNLWVFDRP